MSKNIRNAVIGALLIGVSILSCVICVPATWLAGYVGEAASVAREELGPRALLKKYQWFKSASARLDAMQSNVVAREASSKALTASYEGVLRRDWSRSDSEAFHQVNSEVAGLKGAFNNLASDYNANMAKINFAFCNVGDLPKGADVPLPREYRTYMGE